MGAHGAIIIYFWEENRKLLEGEYFSPLHIYLRSWQTSNFRKKILGTVGDALTNKRNTGSCDNSEMWRRPCCPPLNSTKAPYSLIEETIPLYVRPTSISRPTRNSTYNEKWGWISLYEDSSSQALECTLSKDYQDLWWLCVISICTFSIALSIIGWVLATIVTVPSLTDTRAPNNKME